MEVHKQPPVECDEDQLGRNTSLLEEIAPHPLMQAAQSLGRNGREHFPMLDRVAVDSAAYIDEHLWLDC